MKPKFQSLYFQTAFAVMALAFPAVVMSQALPGTLGQPALMQPPPQFAPNQPFNPNAQMMPPGMNPYQQPGQQGPMVLLQNSQQNAQDYRTGEIQGPQRAPAATVIDPCSQGNMGRLDVQGVNSAGQSGFH